MSLFWGICTLVGFCFVASFLLKALGKVACWVIGGAIAIIGALVMGSAMFMVAAFAVLLLWSVVAAVA